MASSSGGLKVEENEITAPTEFKVSECQDDHLQDMSTISSVTFNNNWYPSSNEDVKTGVAEDPEPVLIYAVSLLDPCSLEQGGYLNEAKFEKDSMNEAKFEKDSISLFENDTSFIGQKALQDEAKVVEDFDESFRRLKEKLKKFQENSASSENGTGNFGGGKKSKDSEQLGIGDKRPFKCNICSVGFKASRHLREHLRIHSDERPFKCDICNKSFRTASCLKRHLTTHSDERRFVCEHCSDGFKTLAILKKHRLVHSGERPFKCEICSIGFKRYSDLNEHP